jgi:aquaporin NIP
VPAYVSAQLIGATLASGTLRLMFTGHQNQFAGTMPAGSNLQTFVLEFIITFYLMFVISGVATDNRAVSSSPLINTLFNFVKSFVILKLRV